MRSHRESHDALLTADENRRMFDEIVPRYDFLNSVLSLGMDRFWRRRAVKALAPVAGGRYLDAGCGTGDLCIEILRRAPGATALGIDASSAMLARAREKAHASGLNGSARFETGDVCGLAFESAVFDGAVSAFCIRNITDRCAAFGELQRVTKPGGHVVLLELTLPRCAFVRACHGFYNRHVVRRLGGALSRRQAYRYLTDSIEAFPDPADIVEEMVRSGMAEVSARPLSAGTVTLFTACRPPDEKNSGRP